MANDPVNYEVVMADLQAKRSALDAVIEAVQHMINVGAHLSAAGGAARAVDPGAIPNDAFFGMSVGEAAKKFLTIVKRKQSVPEIADALDRGGLAHTSSNFVNTVGTMLSRAAKNDPELARVGRSEWGLASWYGNRRPKADTHRKTQRRAERSKPRKQSSSGPTVKTMAAEAIKAAGKPLHIDAILDDIEKRHGLTVKKDTLGAVFSVASRKGDTFKKVSPGVFGLI